MAPELDAALRAAPVERRASAGWRAARWAVERTGLREQAVDAALAGRALHDLVALVDELDCQYLELQEASKSDPDEATVWLIVFSKARAASAVNFATRGEPVEAVYEAGQATNDWAGLRALLAPDL
jgi:hypothetical protein